MREENLQLLKICEDRKVIQGARDALKSGRGGGLFYPRSQMTIGSVPVGFFRHRFHIFFSEYEAFCYYHKKSSEKLWFSAI